MLRKWSLYPLGPAWETRALLLFFPCDQKLSYTWDTRMQVVAINSLLLYKTSCSLDTEEQHWKPLLPWELPHQTLFHSDIMSATAWIKGLLSVYAITIFVPKGQTRISRHTCIHIHAKQPQHHVLPFLSLCKYLFSFPSAKQNLAKSLTREIFTDLGSSI